MLKKIVPALIVLICGNLAFANLAWTDEILPKKPNGPAIKADAITQYKFLQEGKTNQSKAMISAYKMGNFANALKIADELAKKGDDNGNALAGFIYENGLGLGAPDYMKAAQYYQIAAKNDNLDALIGLGRLAAIGQGGIGIIEAMKGLEKAMAANRGDAILPYADLLIKSGTDIKRGMFYYQSLAAKGNAEAAYRAAILLDDGENSPMDDEITASTYLKQAAYGGIPAAQADYGLFLYQGRGITKNLEEAAKYFKLAAENGDDEGAFYWALVNAKAEGVPRNFDTALKYAQIAKATIPEAESLYGQLQKYMAKK